MISNRDSSEAMKPGLFAAPGVPRGAACPPAVWVLIFLMAVATLTTLWSGLGIEVWRQDSMLYQQHFDSKLASEGRWLLWLLFGSLRAAPPLALWLGGILAFGYFAWAVSRENSGSAPLALAVALVAVHLPPLHAQALWPGYLLPSAAVLALAALLRGRLAPCWVFIGAGIALGGALQHFYFLLPLLYLRRFVFDSGRPWTGAARLLLWWLLGFVAGQVVALLALKVITGAFFLSIAAWRRPNPFDGWTSLAFNLARSLGQMRGDLATLASPPWFALALATAAAIHAAVARSISRFAAAALVCLAASTAVYVAVVPLGLGVPNRTALGLYAAPVLFCLAAEPAAGRRLTALVACALVAGLAVGVVSRAELAWYRGVTETYVRDLESLTPDTRKPPATLVVAAGTAYAYQRRIEADLALPPPRVMEPWLSAREGVDFRWRAAAYAAGFDKVRFCQAWDRSWCEQERAPRDADHCTPAPPGLCAHGATTSGHPVVSLTGQPGH